MRKELAKSYSPKDFEDKIYAYWMDNHCFHAEVDRTKNPYTIVIPPPNITGQLHMGHALDETLQDILIRYRRMQGYCTLWLPGTDHASIATEAKIVEAMRKEGITKDDIGRDGFLKRAWAWKEQYGGRIVEQLKKLGSSCDWERERFTMDEGCNRAVREVFVRYYEEGLIYRGERIINWCPHCHTSISNAEVEFEEQDGFFWHLRYPLSDGSGYLELATTRPETLLGDTAVAVNPKDERYQQYVGKTVVLPLVGREIPVVADSYVDMEFGTGVVKITPAHDPNDFEVGRRHDLPVINVMTDDAKIIADYPKYAGMDRYEARKAIVADLEAGGYLIQVEPHAHNVGTCYRCGTTVEPRVSLQWFVKMEELAKPAIDVVRSGKIKFVPERFDKNYFNWMEDIRDWCISRQRVWGVPIPIFYCEDCNEHLVNDDTINAVADLFAKEGSDAWWAHSAEEILPHGTKCPKCGGTHFRKESDIMDVWFDSGSSHAAVCKTRPELAWPADMYLEGSDQHRGWFQSSLLTSVATEGKAPYRAVLTHGYVVDGEGRKMSKSVGNTVAPQEVIAQYGADIIRLWAASSDYKADIRISKEILKQLSEVYRKIRNTIRYILGNTNDFNYETDKVEFKDMLELDRWALMHMQLLKKEVSAAYESYDFHVLYHAIHNFCSVEMSSYYLDILKDRLYAYKADSFERRSAQTAMYEIMLDLVVMIAPVLSFTMEEVWQFMKKPASMPESVFMMPWPECKEEYIDEALESKWDNFIEIRSEITRVLEGARRAKTIGHSLDAKVELHATGEALAILRSVEGDLATLLIVSQAKLVEGLAGGVEATGREDLKVTVQAAEGEKCERCWIYSDTVGKDAEHPTVCARCAAALK